MTQQESGTLVVFEGIEKTGKSTQVERIAEYLRSKGKEIVVTKEPGGGIVEKRREILDGLRIKGLEGFALAEAELSLFLEDRAAHYQCLILPALERGSIILSDRGPGSTVAFQGYGRGISLFRIAEGNYNATRGRIADLTILFDMDPRLIYKRIGKDSVVEVTRFECEPLEFHQRVRNGYLRMAGRDHARWLVVDATKLRDEITKMIITELRRRFGI